MAQPATNPKIEELRFRLKTDPKSRLFYQLAEELRRSGQFTEAEQVLRQGIVTYPTYLAAWVSLGRVLREQKNEDGAAEALNKALQLDPGNVVAARLLADSYLATGNKLEAIKKYKLVHAILPSDEELRGTIERLERELHPPPIAEVPFADDETTSEPEEVPSPVAASEPPAVNAFLEDSPFDRTVPPFSLDDTDRGGGTRDEEPMPVAHDESPFEEPAGGYTAAALEVEAPVGMHIEEAPVEAEVPAPLVYDEEEADVFEPAPPVEPQAPQQITDTRTMADLYARQGLTDDARLIYEHILARDPDDAEVRAKLEALNPPPVAAPEPPAPEPLAPEPPAGDARVEKLERWLAKVSKREAGHV